MGLIANALTGMDPSTTLTRERLRIDLAAIDLRELERALDTCRCSASVMAAVRSARSSAATAGLAQDGESFLAYRSATIRSYNQFVAGARAGLCRDAVAD
jgi:hypothetical protein